MAVWGYKQWGGEIAGLSVGAKGYTDVNYILGYGAFANMPSNNPLGNMIPPKCTSTEIFDMTMWKCLPRGVPTRFPTLTPTAAPTATPTATPTLKATCPPNMITTGVSGGAATCEECDHGSAPNADKTSCKACLIGKFSSKGSLVCTNCVAGEYSSAGSKECSFCASGTSSVAGGICTICPAGTASISGGLCISCAKNTFSANNGESVCKLCPTGSTSNPGASACTGIGSDSKTSGTSSVDSSSTISPAVTIGALLIGFVLGVVCMFFYNRKENQKEMEAAASAEINQKPYEKWMNNEESKKAGVATEHKNPLHTEVRNSTINTLSSIEANTSSTTVEDYQASSYTCGNDVDLNYGDVYGGGGEDVYPSVRAPPAPTRARAPPAPRAPRAPPAPRCR
jgi:hypothetical protein